MSIVKYTQTCSSGNTKDRLDTLPKLTKELNKGEFEMDEVAEVSHIKGTHNCNYSGQPQRSPTLNAHNNTYTHNKLPTHHTTGP
jgi:hypothetical protein